MGLHLNFTGLQLVWKIAACFLHSVLCPEHLTPVHQDLHWLPFGIGMELKVLFLSYKETFNGLEFAYLKDDSLPVLYHHSWSCIKEKVGLQGSLALEITASSPEFHEYVHLQDTLQRLSVGLGPDRIGVDLIFSLLG